MHQHGVGLKQDFHLAKRYLDSSAQTHPYARWPVNLALTGLYFHWWYCRGGATDKPIVRTADGGAWVLWSDFEMVEGLRDVMERWKERLGRGWERVEELVEVKFGRERTGGLFGGGGGGAEEEDDGDMWAEEEEEEEGEAWDWRELVRRAKESAPALDTLLIGLLTLALLYVLRVRAEQRDAARRRRAAEGGGSVPPPAAQLGQQSGREHQD